MLSIILIIISITLVITGIAALFDDAPIIALILIVSGFSIMYNLPVVNNHKVYEKASDMPYWELSDKQFKSDTTTIDTLYFNNKADTVYRTIHYIVVE